MLILCTVLSLIKWILCSILKRMDLLAELSMPHP